MGTRNLTIVKLDGEIKVAQYCQWDGYPTGVGTDIAKLLKTLDIPKLKKQVKQLSFYSKKELDTRYKEIEKTVNKIDSKTYSERDNEAMRMYPELHRDTGPQVLGLIQRGQVTKVDNQINFLRDGLFCEYAYAIDLNKKTVTVLLAGNNPHKTYKFVDFTVTAMKRLEKELRGQ